MVGGGGGGQAGSQSQRSDISFTALCLPYKERVQQQTIFHGKSSLVAGGLQASDSSHSLGKMGAISHF